MRKLIVRMLGPKVMGMLDYYRYPQRKLTLGGALNGQEHRKRMVRAFVDRIALDAIVETGTFCGATSTYLANLTTVPIYTVEYDARLHGFSRMALRRCKNVQCFNDDSRRFLRKLACVQQLHGKTVLFYLDAHWGEDLPLAEELDIIFGNWPRGIALIDDFEVVGDPGYKYDDYGMGKALTLGYIKSAVERYRLRIFYPSAPSTQETGIKRGCVVLVADASLIETMALITEIREYVDRVR